MYEFFKPATGNGLISAPGEVYLFYIIHNYLFYYIFLNIKFYKTEGVKYFFFLIYTYIKCIIIYEYLQHLHFFFISYYIHVGIDN